MQSAPRGTTPEISETGHLSLRDGHCYPRGHI